MTHAAFQLAALQSRHQAGAARQLLATLPACSNIEIFASVLDDAVHHASVRLNLASTESISKFSGLANHITTTSPGKASCSIET
jgi:hypothetical protein